MRHLDNSAKVMLATGLIVGYGYVMEAFMGWYSGNMLRCLPAVEPPARALLRSSTTAADLQHRDPALFWINKLRNNPVWLFLVSLVVLVGMWLERFIIVVVSLHCDFLHVVVGHVLPHALGLDDLHRTIGLFLSAIAFLFVRHPAHDFHLRNADAAARRGGEARNEAHRRVYGIDG